MVTHNQQVVTGSSQRHIHAPENVSIILSMFLSSAIVVVVGNSILTELTPHTKSAKIPRNIFTLMRDEWPNQIIANQPNSLG